MGLLFAMRYAGSIFLSAFLLFQVQLILAKFLLPWFGGAPAVWTTCLLFFQFFLLLGYAYAFWIDRRLPPRGQARLHAGLLLLAVASMGAAWWIGGSPVLPGEAWKPAAGATQPVSRVLLILLVSIGLCYTLLAANSPLIQRWYGAGSAPVSPYRLYAVSNAGSLLALLSYPFLVEPAVTLHHQALIWAGLYVVFAGITVACVAASLSLKTRRPGPAAPREPAAEGSGGAGPLVRLYWLVLAACPASMLLAITNDLSQEVAVTPFVWVLPLTIYLLSFIICFDHARWYSRRVFVLLTYAASMTVLITSLKGFALGMPAHLASYSFFLFCFCMVCHGELYRLRPGQHRLTTFYLTIALGGVTGGILVGILAPALFRGYWEFHLAILASWVLLTLLFWKDKASFLNTGDRWHFFGLLLLCAYCLTHYSLAFSGGYRIPLISGHRELANLAIAAVVALLLFLPLRNRPVARSPLWPRLLAGLLIFLVESFAVYRVRSGKAAALAADRNFFGVVQVTELAFDPGYGGTVRNLVHGKILHGFQFTGGALELAPTSYYVNSSGAGIALNLHARRQQGLPLRVGVTGLGAGGITAHMRAGDLIRFYEINPLVVDFAYGEGALFSYLNKSPATVEVVLGDARLALEAELAAAEPGAYDVLVLDAFSSDSVPFHLLTREAFHAYLAHLRDNESILAVNITNRFLDLSLPVLSLAHELGLDALRIDSPGELPHPTASSWILLSRGSSLLGDPRVLARATPVPAREPLVWTDDFSNLWRVLRRGKGGGVH